MPQQAGGYPRERDDFRADLKRGCEWRRAVARILPSEAILEDKDWLSNRGLFLATALLPDDSRLRLAAFADIHGRATWPTELSTWRLPLAWLTPKRSACPWTKRVQLARSTSSALVRDFGCRCPTDRGGRVRNRFGRLTAMMVVYKIITYPTGRSTSVRTGPTASTTSDPPTVSWSQPTLPAAAFTPKRSAGPGTERVTDGRWSGLIVMPVS